MGSRQQQKKYAKEHGLRLSADVDSLVSVRSNLWGRSVEWDSASHRGVLPPLVYRMTRSPSECPGEPAFIDLAFERGVPTSINGVQMPFLELVANLGALAATHGVGRIKGGIGTAKRTRVLQAGEAPAAVLLHRAHHELRRLAAPDLEKFGRTVGLEYAAIVAEGRWFSPLREALDAYVERVQTLITGSVRLKLFKGEFGVVGPVVDKAWTTRHAPVPAVTEGP